MFLNIFPKLSYTIIGGEVNVAQRLEASADSNGILMSYETYAFTQDIVEVEEMVPLGALDADDIHLSGIFVQRIFQGKNHKNPIEYRTITERS